MTAVIRSVLLLAKSEIVPRESLVNIALDELDAVERVKVLLILRQSNPDGISEMQQAEIDRWLGLEVEDADAQD